MADGNTQRIIDDGRRVIEDSKTLADDISHAYQSVRAKALIGRYYDENPYAIIGAAAGIGYVLGGGLFTPFTKRILRLGMKAMVIPLASAQLKSLSGGVGGSEG